MDAGSDFITLYIQIEDVAMVAEDCSLITKARWLALQGEMTLKKGPYSIRQRRRHGGVLCPP
jgi:hypothetical protein